ncbi:MAG TPA: redoxin family protein [Planctomycetota bacterium]|nr:redoxin family protein [Planctomycetota bacterium]
MTAAASAQVDLERARAELDRVFDRPAGTVIGAEQRAALSEFVKRHADVDLGPLAYARAMLLYLQRDLEASAAAFDEFFAGNDTIANDEHRNLAGRVYLAALAAAAREGTADEALLRERARRAARLYDDLRTLARIAAPLLAENGKIKDRVGVRVALARGAAAGRADDAALDTFLGAIYAGAAPVQQPPARQRPADLTGKAAPDFKATHVVDRRPDAPRELALADLRGRVVLLDFFATWCPPCRAGVDHLAELQRKHGDALAVVGVTRFYGRGMDFSAPDAVRPHGGKYVQRLDREQELAVNEAFVRAFDLPYPLVFVDAAVSTAYGVTSIPTVFVLDRDGKVVGSVVGNQPEQIDELLAKATAVASGGEPAHVDGGGGNRR